MPAAPKKNKSAWQGTIDFPDVLPISARVDDIAAAIKENQVLILAGETGSGKTTQLPKICLSLGYGQKGLIAHTQPRRIAARTVADRIASELGCSLGGAVGYQVRFKDVSGPDTRIKLMTDGILLAEFQRDRLLRDYQVIIIDEAHERSLNIDFILGLLKPLCKKRPDLKIIITSATIDLDRFAQHFSRNNSPAPIIEVSGRTYPVETLYFPTQESHSNLAEEICASVKYIVRNEAKGKFKASGDILVFCVGEREIRDAALALRRSSLQLDILPLYSRLSVSEQNKVFQSAQHRKVVLATNVAETSITVPGIAYVIDPGLERISRYSFRSKVQRLPVEAISQASANQRLGRCGRVTNGVCIRLYSEEDFLSRAEFTPAEILRSNLASVILKMRRLGIREIEKFNFIDKPDKRLLNDGLKLLEQLNALDKRGDLTQIGKQMSELPIDPKYARILVAANHLGCLRDALIVVSGLSIRDPRERPSDSQAAADQAHLWLQHPQSEFFSYLQLWQAINNYREELSNTQFRKMCDQRYWSIARIFEWRELYRQLATQTKSLKWKIDDWQAMQLPIEGEKRTAKKQSSFDQRYENLHLALISGLLGNIASKDPEGDYQATRNRSVGLFPTSPFKKHKPQWLLCAELMETSQLYMMTAAQIRPDWIIKTAPKLCRYRYSEPRFDARMGAVRAIRTTLFYGLVVRDKEAINYAPVNKKEAHELFIRQALVDGQLRGIESISALQKNAQLISEIEKIEVKTRKRNLLVDQQQLYEFYCEQIPQHVCGSAQFNKWIKEPSNSESLILSREQVLLNAIDQSELAQFPDSLEVLGKQIKLKYHFEPGSHQDGVSMVLPISVLAPYPDHIGDWLVPGLVREKCVALIKTLPKSIRRNFAPAAQAVDRVMPKLSSQNTAMHEVLAERLKSTTGVAVKAADFDLDKLDPYYRMNYRVLDIDNSLINESRDLSEIKRIFANEVKASVHADNAPERKKLEKHDLEQWNFGELSASKVYQHQGMSITAYPMLQKQEDGSISLLLSDKPESAKYYTQIALPLLALKYLQSNNGRQSYKYLQQQLFKQTQPSKQRLGSLAAQLSSIQVNSSELEQWREKVIVAALNAACFANDASSIRDEHSFLVAMKGAKDWVKTALELETSLATALKTRDQLLAKLEKINPQTLSLDTSVEDIKAQLYQLFEPDFLSYTAAIELQQYTRYLRAIEARLDLLHANKPTVAQLKVLYAKQDELNGYINRSGYSTAFMYITRPSLREYALMLQEWRVSIFAQHLRTRSPVSEKRLSKLWEQVLKQ